MTSPVLAALVNARAQEQAEQDRALTAKVLAHLGMPAPQGDKSQWSVWQQWCDRSGIVSCPAVPAAIAVWILKNPALGDRLEKIVGSIGAVHEADGRANPVLSPIVIEALHQVLPVKAPRSRVTPPNGKTQRGIQKCQSYPSHHPHRRRRHRSN